MAPIDSGLGEHTVVEHRNVRPGRLEPAREATRHGAPKQTHRSGDEGRDQTLARQAVAIIRIGEPDGKPGLGLAQVVQRAHGERARNRPIDQAVATDRRSDLMPVPLALDVGVQPDLYRRQEAERFIEGRQLGRDFSQLFEPESANVPSRT